MRPLSDFTNKYQTHTQFIKYQYYQGKITIKTKLINKKTPQKTEESKETFSKEKLQHLNKDLNSVSTPKAYNKQELNEEIKKFYCAIKLKRYFKDLNKSVLLAENQVFKTTNHKNRRPIKTIIWYNILKLLKRI